MHDCLSSLAEKKMVNQLRYFMFSCYPAGLILVYHSPEEAAAEPENKPHSLFTDSVVSLLIPQNISIVLLSTDWLTKRLNMNYSYESQCQGRDEFSVSLNFFSAVVMLQQSKRPWLLPCLKEYTIFSNTHITTLHGINGAGMQASHFPSQLSHFRPSCASASFSD